MKKIFFALAAVAGLFAATSCEDMLESDSTRQAFEPELNSKTDSVFYAFGIMQAMQQLADQYVFQGELRGELLKTTVYTDNNLRRLYDYTATTANKYDSAYVYYRVINNCNYYIAHRDTTLYTGATNVTLQEYAAVKAMRAWAYLQLGRNYERVPFFFDPLTKISQIDDNTYERLQLTAIADKLIDDLLPFSGYELPNYGNVAIDMGNSNAQGPKVAVPMLCFIPVDVILGELYLERGNYAQAINHFVTYLTKVPSNARSSYMAASKVDGGRTAAGSRSTQRNVVRPSDYDQSNEFRIAYDWSGIFASNATQDIISYIPMATSYVRGVTTDLPKTFGYDYYATSSELTSTGSGRNRRYIDEVQLLPSDAFYALSDAQDYHYYASVSGELPKRTVNAVAWGDMRVVAATETYSDGDSTMVWINKFNNADVVLYRNSTVLLMLAEAYNRLGYPRIAFAILKEGITPYLTTADCTYLTDEDKAELSNTILSPANLTYFSTANNTPILTCGIHTHGAGETRSYNGSNIPNTPYMPDIVIGKKMKQIADAYGSLGVQVGTTLADTINAVEDLLCDEMALELAWEGRRYYDLLRLARHKNDSSPYGADFGTLWLNEKIRAVKGSAPASLYLPFQ